MKQLTVFLFFFTAFTVQAQESIDEILRKIELTNRELHARKELAESQILEAKTGNYLPNPTIEYSHQWGNRSQMGKTGELEVRQEFDFPTVYAYRSEVAQLRRSQYDRERAAFRLELLLRAKEVCIELLYLQKQKVFLTERLSNARRLSELYSRRLAAGDANILDVNKIEMELIGVQTEVDLNSLAISAKLTELANLNGGERLSFTLREYPAVRPPDDFESLYRYYLERSPELQGYKNEQAVADKEVALSKAQVLPKFALGYKGDYAFGENFNGVLVGLSIPMFENKNTVKRAKAQARFAEAQAENAVLNLRSELQKLYDQANTLQNALQKAHVIIERFGNYEPLNEALEMGEILITDYFFELISRYECYRTLLELERDYHLTLARLYKYEL